MSEILLKAKRFCVERVVQTMADGSQHTRDIVRHPGAVVILPILDDGRICLLRNYRIAIDKTLIELPAGTLEPGEDPRETARRELAEETGYRAGRIEHLLTFFTSPGILDEKMYLFLAENLQAGEMSLEVGEQIQPFLCTFNDALELIHRGDIQDAKTIASLLYYTTFKSRQK